MCLLSFYVQCASFRNVCVWFVMLNILITKHEFKNTNFHKIIRFRCLIASSKICLNLVTQMLRFDFVSPKSYCWNWAVCISMFCRHSRATYWSKSFSIIFLKYLLTPSSVLPWMFFIPQWLLLPIRQSWIEYRVRSFMPHPSMLGCPHMAINCWDWKGIQPDRMALLVRQRHSRLYT